MVVKYHHALLCRITTTNFNPNKLKYFAMLGNCYLILTHINYREAAVKYMEHLDDMCTLAMDARRTIADMAVVHGHFIEYYEACEGLASETMKSK